MWTNMIGKTHRYNQYRQTSVSIPDSADRTLDVREIDGAPFGDIMQSLEDLPDGETLLLQTSFEPEPLYDVLSQRGFDYETTQVEDDLWHIEICHG